MIFKNRFSMSVAGTIAAMPLVEWAAIAQQPSGQMSQKRSSMNMGDMMKQCKAHCERTTAEINQSRKDIEAAEQSNDPAKMRSAYGPNLQAQLRLAKAPRPDDITTSVAGSTSHTLEMSQASVDRFIARYRHCAVAPSG